MGVFATSEPQLQVNSVTTAAKLIWQISGTLPSGTVIPAAFATAGGNITGVTVLNSGTVTLYVGGSTVTTATGVPVGPNSQLTLQGPMVALYGITASGTTFVEAGLTSIPSVI